jgi:hypothetical protein
MSLNALTSIVALKMEAHDTSMQQDAEMQYQNEPTLN